MADSVYNEDQHLAGLTNSSTLKGLTQEQIDELEVLKQNVASMNQQMLDPQWTGQYKKDAEFYFKKADAAYKAKQLEFSAAQKAAAGKAALAGAEDIDLAGLDTAMADVQNALTAVEQAQLPVEVQTRAARLSPGYTGTDLTDNESEMVSAYDTIVKQLAPIGLGGLVADVRDLLMAGTRPSEMALALKETPAYKERFSANDARIKNGLRALSPAEYIAKEEAYQNIMRQYGLPASYYTPGKYGKQSGFDALISNDVDDAELEDRIATAQERVLNTNPEVLQALKQFYPDISNADILAYTLDPKNSIQNIKRKVTAAEIGGAALAQGLQASGGTAEALAGQGVTKAQAQEGYQTVAELAPRGGQLAAMYGESPYGQAQAEAEVFGTAGAAAATQKRKKLKALEEANFAGSSGVGALSRERATNYGTTQSGYGAY